MTITSQLRKEIETCGRSRYRISRDTGISEAALSRFMSGERGLAIETIEKLIDYFGYKLVKRRRK
jgi:DNA transposition AAA+ family ATPase